MRPKAILHFELPAEIVLLGNPKDLSLPAKYVEIRTSFKNIRITLKATLGLDAACWKIRELPLTAVVHYCFTRVNYHLSHSKSCTVLVLASSARVPEQIHCLQSYLVFISLCVYIHFIDLSGI